MVVRPSPVRIHTSAPLMAVTVQQPAGSQPSTSNVVTSQQQFQQIQLQLQQQQQQSQNPPASSDNVSNQVDCIRPYHNESVLIHSRRVDQLCLCARCLYSTPMKPSRRSLLPSSLLPLTHYRPAMPFGNRKNYFRGFFRFSFVTI